MNIAVEVNHIVIPAEDRRATAGLLAYVLGLEVEGGSGELIRIRTSKGLRLDFSEPRGCWALQCAFLVSDAEFDHALSRITTGCIDFYAAFDRARRGEINRAHGGRCIYFDDPDGHLFELIVQRNASALDSRIRAVAIKLTN